MSNDEAKKPLTPISSETFVRFRRTRSHDGLVGDGVSELRAAAMTALRALGEAEGFGAMQAVCGEATADHMKAVFADVNEVKEAEGEVTKIIRSSKKELIPGLLNGGANDGAQLWARSGVPLLYTVQPHYVTQRGLELMLTWAKQRDLEISLSGNSWQMPGRTMLVTLSYADGPKKDEAEAKAVAAGLAGLRKKNIL